MTDRLPTLIVTILLVSAVITTMGMSVTSTHRTYPNDYIQNDIAVPSGVAAFIGVGTSGGPTTNERVPNAYADDALRAWAKKTPGADYNRAAARLDDLLKPIDRALGLSDWNRLLDQVKREMEPASPAVEPHKNLGNGFPDNLFDPDLKPNRVAFVRWLIKEAIFAAPSDTFGERGFELLLYEDGYFRDGAVAYAHARIEAAFEHLGLTASGTFAQETVRSVVRRSLKPRSSFNPAGFLNLENGTYELATGELHPHSPARRFTWQAPMKFDPAATCPVFMRFLTQVLPPEKTRREIQKLFGYCIGVPGHPYQCAHLFVGEGNNGKSTVLSVLNSLLGKENVAAETLTSLTENRFAPANLWGKLANVFADLPSNPLRYTSVFKALTGGDKVRAEAKFGKTFYFVNGAKLVFSANELPEVNDRTRAFWRRWQLVRFDRDFTGREDRTLLSKLLGELPGILNWALAGIPMLAQDQGFLTELGADDLKSEWRRRSDTLAWFVSEQVIVNPTERTPKEEFYQAYAEFCAANQASSKSPENVGKELPRHVPTVRTEKPRINGEFVRCWRGLCLRPDTGVQPPVSPASPVSEGSQTHLPGPETGETSETGSRTSVPAGPVADAETRVGPGRIRHPNCPLCVELDHHVCDSCTACRSSESQGPEAKP